MLRPLPLHIIVGIEQAALPQACDFLCLLLRGAPRYSDKHHERLPFLCHFQDALRLPRIYLGEVNRCRGSLMLWKISLFYVIIFLARWGKASNHSSEPRFAISAGKHLHKTGQVSNQQSQEFPFDL